MHEHVGKHACRYTCKYQINTHPWSCGADQRSVVSSVTPLLCVAQIGLSHSHADKQMENSIRKPHGSNSTNAIFTPQAWPVWLLRAQLIHFVLPKQFRTYSMLDNEPAEWAECLWLGQCNFVADLEPEVFFKHQNRHHCVDCFKFCQQ